MLKLRQAFNTIFNSSSPANDAVINSDWVDDEIRAAQERLKIKRDAAVERLGEKWILHKVHMKHNLNRKPNTLGKKTA